MRATIGNEHLIRVPLKSPANPEYETFVLGALFLIPSSLTVIVNERPRLRPEHFYWPQHRAVFEAMLALEQRGDGIDPTTVLIELRTRVARLGDKRGYGEPTPSTFANEGDLELLAGAVPAIGNIRQYAAEVVRLAEWRERLQSVYGQLEAIAVEDDDAYAAAVRTADKIADEGLKSPYDLGSDWVDWYQSDTSTAIPTPWPKITAGLFGGFRPGDVTILTGWPGMGKSTTGDQILEYGAQERNLSACVYVNEMSEIDRTSRLLSARAGVPFERILARDLTPAQIKRVLKAAPELPFSLQPCSGWSADQIARSLKHHRWGLAFVDLGTRIPASTTAEWDHVSGVLNDAARQAGTHLLIAVQLNRERNDKMVRPMPVLRDLRNTGAWEADARNVLIVHRTEEIDRETGLPVVHDDGILHLAKASNGRPGTAERVVINYARMRFDVLNAVTSAEAGSGEAWAF